jgi:hypothetical protein
MTTRIKLSDLVEAHAKVRRAKLVGDVKLEDLAQRELDELVDSIYRK